MCLCLCSVYMSENERLNGLSGNVVFHPSFATPYDIPTFLRAAALRVVAGSMLLAAALALCAAIVASSDTDRSSCALAFCTCVVAFYHYKKLVSIREQTGSHVTLTKPGDTPVGQAPGLKLAWQELNVDAVRYSDWAVTLTPLIIDLHIIVGGHTAFFSISWSVMLCIAMVMFGSFTRLGTDELVPGNQGRGLDGPILFGIVSFALSSVCLALVLANLLVDLENDPSNGWVYAFSLPWVGYGVVALISIVWRQFDAKGYPELLSIFKDLAFGTLDVWSKATFTFWVSTKAFGINTLVFGF